MGAEPVGHLNNIDARVSAALHAVGAPNRTPPSAAPLDAAGAVRGRTVARGPFRARRLLWWALTEIIWAAVTGIVHQCWPASLLVFAVILGGFLVITVGTARCAWRVMAGC